MRKPVLLGRFNYLTVDGKTFSIVFYPSRGASCAIIARNLTKEQMKTFLEDLNHCTKNFFDEVISDPISEPE